MNYFGCIIQEQFEVLSEEAQLTFLLSEDIYTTINVIDLPVGESTPLVFNEKTKRQVPNKIVIDQLYKFVTEQYNEFISQQFYSFQIDFNEKKYGLKKSKQRKIALKYFKDYYSKVATKAVALVQETPLENGSYAIDMIDKQAFLKEQQNTLESNLSKTVLLQQFLFGNKDYFVTERINEFKILAEVIDFEAAKRIMLSLNGQYHFEKGASSMSKNKNTRQPIPNSGVEQNQASLKNDTVSSPISKTVTKRPTISDEDAIDYLIENVFQKKKLE